MTQRINPTKQGYRLILVPATGVKWSTVWSTVLPQTTATPPPRDAVYDPALRLVTGVRQLAVSGCERLC